jgi:exosortase H (IPTLxxWG-CTERM-specific)
MVKSARIRFLVLFVLIIVVSYFVIALKAVDRAFVTPFSAGVTSVSAGLLRLAGQDVVNRGTMMQARSFAVDVKNGCNGLEAVIIVVAAVLAFPAPWKKKIIGLLLGFGIVEGFNIIRVITLFVIGRDYPKLFEAFHVTIWQSLMFVVSIAVFLVWSRNVTRSRPADA